MAKSRLEIQKQILEDLNKRADVLVEAILNEAEISKSALDPSKVQAINDIIHRLEGMTFNGNIELLKSSINVYDKAIKAIDEQLKSENMKDFEKFSTTSLENAKKLLEAQSKNGRIGTIFEKVEEIAKAEKSGDIEKRYNDEQIEQIDYNVKEQKESEAERLNSFNKVMAQTRIARENLQEVDAIVKKVEDLVKEREECKKKLASPDASKEEKEELKKDIEFIEKEIQETSAKAKTDEKDTAYDMNKGEKIEAYIKRIQEQLKAKTQMIEAELISEIKNIKDVEIDLGTEKKRVEDYLKDYMADAKNLHNLTNKLTVDKMMLRKNIEKDDKHKEMQELENKKRVYEQRNEELQGNNETFYGTGRNSNTTTVAETKEMVAYETKFDWKHPFKSLKNMRSKRGEKSNTKNGNTNEITAVDSLVLKEVEKSVKSIGKGFKAQYKVEEKDRISAEVETVLNTRREKFYQQLEQEEAKKAKDNER